MSGKHQRRARRADQWARWCERKLERLPPTAPESKRQFYRDAAEWGRRMADRTRRDAVRSSSPTHTASEAP